MHQPFFADDFSEADGTTLDGKAPDTGNAWVQTGESTAITVQGNAVNTAGGARVGTASFTRSTTALETTTVTLSNLAIGGAGNFFSSGFSSYILRSGTTQQISFGDLAAANFWGIAESRNRGLQTLS